MKFNLLSTYNFHVVAVQYKFTCSIAKHSKACYMLLYHMYAQKIFNIKKRTSRPIALNVVTGLKYM